MTKTPEADDGRIRRASRSLRRRAFGPSLRLCGVRKVRAGPIDFVDAAGVDVIPGQVVVLAAGDEEGLGTVVVGPEQLADVEAAVTSSGRILRCATAEDVESLGRRAAAAIDAVPRARDRCRELGIEADFVGAWLTPDGSKLVVTVSVAPSNVDGLIQELVRTFALPVDLEVAEPDGTRRLSSGIAAGGLAPEWPQWLSPALAAVRVLPPTASRTPATEFIGRLFPPGHRFERRPHRD